MTEQDDLWGFAEVKTRRADEVADVLDHQRRVALRVEALQGATHHGRVEMAALASVDLERRCTRGANAIRIEACLLIAFDDGDRQAVS